MAIAFPAARMASTDRAELAVHELGGGAPVVFCHGFPDLAFSFRHQLPALADAGFRAIAPDLPGVGATSRPRSIDAYGLHEIATDIAALLDVLSLERAVFVGHDFGALVAYELALSFPSRVAAVIGLVMPHSPAPPIPPTALWREALGESFYLLALLAPGAAARLERDVDRTIRYFFRRCRGLESDARPPLDVPGLALLDELAAPEAEWSRASLLTAEEHARYRDTYERTGFDGALCWYRNVDRNWERRRGRDERIEVPVLLVTAEHGAIVPAAHTAGMERLCPDLTRAHIEDAGHFVHQERPEEVNRVIIEFLRAKLRGAS
jgi:pimeloyl-ACP methyl ester carboxylesterase